MPPAAPLRDPAQAGRAHQARDSVFAAALTLVAQLVVHARAAEDAIAIRMDRVDAFEQCSIVPCSLTQGSLAPIVVATRRAVQTAAHQAHRERLAAALDHAVPHRDSFAKNAAPSILFALT